VKTLTEDQIETKVERFIDHIDRIFLAGQISQEDYNKAARDIEAWADRKRAEAEEIHEQASLKRKHDIARARDY
jgi:hypothetical protein